MSIYYFDNAATTRAYDEVITAVSDFEKDIYANPSSLHAFGGEAYKAVDYAASNILEVLNLKGKYNVVFTCGATESANLAIKGTANKFNDIKKIHVITSVFEHPCVSESVKYLNRCGAETDFVGVDKYGMINLNELLSKIKPNTKLVSFIWVNNETGALQQAQKITEAVKNINKNIIVHIDATQGFGKIQADLSGADMITVSAHKFHGPKGVGALIMKNSVTLQPVLSGGGQQKGLRSGTVNAPSIYGMGKACEILLGDFPYNKLREKQEYLYEKITAAFGDDVINTRIFEADYAPHIISLSFEGLKSEVLLHMLEQDNIYVSSGSACSSHAKHSSVLNQTGLSKAKVDGALRISISEFTSNNDIDFLVSHLESAVKRLREIGL